MMEFPPAWGADSRQGLANSNHRRESAITHPISPASGVDRRAIPLGAREQAWTAPDGHPIRRLDLAEPAAPRGSLLFLGGRGDFYEKYLEALAHWSGRGWRVTAIDWRGQGGSGRLAADPQVGDVPDFALWIDDLAAFWREWSAGTEGARVVVAHSMGGHLVLRALAEARIDPDAAVLLAPMLGLTAPLPPRLGHALARAMMRVGDPARQAWRIREGGGAGREARLTHCAERYADERWWCETRPELTIGAGSWRWLERAYASMRALDAPGVLERIATPLLILAARQDALVAFAAIARAARRLPNAELVAFGPEARHEVLREADGVRTRALGAIDKFLERGD